MMSSRWNDERNPANTEHLEYIKDLGYQQAPVVVIDDEQHWSGYRPDRVRAASCTAGRHQ